MVQRIDDSLSRSSGSSFLGSSRSAPSSRVVARSQQFLAELFERMRPQLKWVARQQTQSIPNCKEDESDIVQRSVVKAIERLSQFDGETSGQWRAWLVQIVRNQAKDVRRYWNQECRAFRQEEHDSQVMRGIEDRSMMTPSKIMDAEERKQLMDSALASLNIQQQALVRWRVFQCATYREIAARLNVTEPTARRRYDAAQSAFRQALERLGE